MRFLLTIYADEGRWESADEATRRETTDAYWALDREAQQRGAFVESAGLEAAASARTLRIRDGEPAVTDGPFVETKEQLGGFYLLECEGLEEALEWAAKIPAAHHGAVEVRQVADYEAEGYPAPAEGASQSA
jgi:hypothetical protein